METLPVGTQGFGMGLHEAKDIESRFTRYVEGLVSVIGHADRAVPLHDYCLGLVMPGERKSVEPMAAITATRCGRWCCQRSSVMERSRPGSSTTRAFPSRDGIRSGCRTNTADSLASRRIARSR